MAAGDATQRGTTYLIGLDNVYYAGWTAQAATVTTTENVTEHMDDRGAVDSLLIQNPGKAMNLTLDIVSSDVANFVPPAKGGVVSVKGPQDSTASNWRVVDATVSGSSGIAQLTMSLIKEDSMASTYTSTSALAAVTNLAAGTPAETSMPLTWTVAASASGYRVYYNTADVRPADYDTEIGSGSATGVTIYGLTTGTKYYFWVETLGGTLPNPVTDSINETTA